MLYNFYEPAIFSHELESKYLDYGKVIVTKFNNAPFPHSSRVNGYTYNQIFYESKKHYTNNTVVIFIPAYYIPNKPIHLFFYFHGWFDNVFRIIEYQKLIEQSYESKQNAIYVFTQGPLNSPDSGGGKLEEKDKFKDYVKEIVLFLNNNKITNSKKLGNIVIAGHSGAYRIISYILLHGGLTSKIKEVYLFDGLYEDTERYIYWFDNYEGKFIVVYTLNGGTQKKVLKLQENLTGWEVPFLEIEEPDLTSREIKKNQIIFLLSQSNHSDVVHENNNLAQLLSASEFALLPKKPKRRIVKKPHL